MAVHPVFLDVDTGVDDAMALVYLFGSADADIVGIASTAGNVPVHQVCQNNLASARALRDHRRAGVDGLRDAAAEPLRTAEDTHGPQGLGYARLPAPTGSSPPTTPPRRGCGPRTPTPVS